MTEQTEMKPGTCDGIEQDAFEEWARGQGMNMNQHPLHYLFLDPVTNGARQAWKAGLMHCKERMEVETPAVAVKPLQWEPGIVDWARPLPGMKYVACSSEGGKWSWWLEGEDRTHAVQRQVCENEAAAKAEAQKDFDQRIIAHSPQPPLSPQEAAMVLLDDASAVERLAMAGASAGRHGIATVLRAIAGGSDHEG
ncbi:hypothetical protein N6L27_03675 [Leisingera sp. SS27]|uniref:hypothetical protein n=1 Tax=Leisingera sp. SS27 TaxID=2979462 RepID=UPI00232E4811|nr:hypothetical protein [Leisingera sp. SS27]MDC0657090.1 hypothetical protein [Leisingera sp. SS27]